MAKLLTEAEIQVLMKNENVVSVDERQIIYKNEFKSFFVEQYLAGKGPTLIFECAGLDKKILGAKRIEKATRRWVTAYEKGTLGVSATLKPNQIYTDVKGITDKEKIKRQEAKIKLLEAEVALLKKVDERERMLINLGNTISSSAIFELIRMIIADNHLKNVVSYLCRSAGVSRSGYYNYIASEDKRLKREAADLESREHILKAFVYRGYKKGSRFGLCAQRRQCL